MSVTTLYKSMQRIMRINFGSCIIMENYMYNTTFNTCKITNSIANSISF